MTAFEQWEVLRRAAEAGAFEKEYDAYDEAYDPAEGKAVGPAIRAMLEKARGIVGEPLLDPIVSARVIIQGAFDAWKLSVGHAPFDGRFNGTFYAVVIEAVRGS